MFGSSSHLISHSDVGRDNRVTEASNTWTWLARMNQIATHMKHDALLQHGEVDAVNQAIDLLTSVVLPALQEGVLDLCDDDTQGDFRGHEEQSKDDELPAVKRRRRSRSGSPSSRSTASTPSCTHSEILRISAATAHVQADS